MKTKNNPDLLKINLVDKYRFDTELQISFAAWREKNSVYGFTDINEALNLKTGDIIEFLGGYNNDILYTTEILGFDKDGDIYVLWDCYWFPIKNEPKRNIRKIN